jgi:hypothetical protein
VDERELVPTDFEIARTYWVRIDATPRLTERMFNTCALKASTLCRDSSTRELRLYSIYHFRFCSNIVTREGSQAVWVTIMMGVFAVMWVFRELLV